ncbi:MAG: DUF1553 domain-containing protein [Blastocatellia bacterium]
MRSHVKTSLLLLLSVCAFLWLAPAGNPRAQEADPDHFESRIRPLLVSRCYDCHAEAASGGLRVDSREALLKGGSRGPAVVPGKPEESLLLRAVDHTHETLRMPKGGAKLREAEIADLTQWIRAGAAWPATPAGKPQAAYRIKPEHRSFWSFQPVLAPPVPGVRGRTNDSIDAFLLAKLESSGLTFRPEADKRTLIRRAAYDLTGLPPAPDEVEAFLADTAPNAFEKLVDRLLASPHYGERWARHWLDLARYSDTVGLVDAGRNLQAWYPYAYTYRDWIVRALNGDMPYDQFLMHQIAADRMPGNDSRNLAALGFLSLSRGGLGVTREEKLDDKIDLVSRGLMGLTVSCARCHNHKFDPIPTRDYYSLFTIFANTREPEELPLLDPRAAAENRHILALAEERRKIDDEIAKMREKRFPELKALYRTAPEIARLLFASWESRDLKIDDDLQKFAREKDYNLFLLKRWREALKDPGGDGIWLVWRGLAAIPEKTFSAATAASAIASAGRVNPLIARAFAEPPASLREAADAYGKLLASFDKPSVCANPEEEALRLALHGEHAPTNAGFSDYEKIMLSTDRQNENGKKRRLETLFLAQAYEGAPPRAQSVEDLPEPRPGHVLIRGNPANKGEEAPAQFLQIVAGDARKPFTDGSGRLELARAIADRNNPLTARVMVNRIWQHHFGAGLVRTPSDFGSRGDRPTHPELLDHLARGFIDSGWSMKELHRRIMRSRAYRQSSSPEEDRRGGASMGRGAPRPPHEIDPENKLLWRMNRRRLEFEELRDSLLAAGGSLDRAMGGLPESAIAWPYAHRRTLYAFIDRALVPNDFRAFDFASPDAHTPQRYLTTVPQQALMMMNSPFVIEQAKSLIERPEISAEHDARRRVQRIYRLLFGRAPAAAEVALGLKFVGEAENDSGLISPAEEARMRAWSCGQGEYDGEARRVTSFTPFRYFLNGAWRSSAMPGDPRTPTSFITARGGFASEEKGKALIRRWTSPFDGRVEIRGLLEQSFDNGCRKCDGLPARIHAERRGGVGEWSGGLGRTETNVEEIDVARGETIDFVVEARKTEEFKWMATIRRLDGPAGEWNSARDFRHPASGPLGAWQRYAQVLLASVEFMMID